MVLVWPGITSALGAFDPMTAEIREDVKILLKVGDVEVDGLSALDFNNVWLEVRTNHGHVDMGHSAFIHNPRFESSS